jgi:hypothetical protein
MISQTLKGHQTSRNAATPKINSAHTGAFFMGIKMRKMLAILVVSLSIVWTIAANAAGTIAFSLSQQLDNNGNPLGGCKLYTIQAGTTSTPQNAYQDTALTIPQSNPIFCDAFGRLPQFFFADGQIKVRLTDRNDNPVFTADNILVIGPSAGGGGGGGSVDPTTILTTGDFKAAYGIGPITGFVRCNARTIGSATSGASERANADTQALYVFLWNADPNLSVIGGRGASAGADFAANKAITLPDCRGRVIAGLDDMGNSAAGRLTAIGFGASAPTTLGAAGGADNFAVTLNNLPTSITAAGAGLSVTVTSTTSNVDLGFTTVNNGTNGLVNGVNGTGAITSTGTTAAQAVTSNNTGANAGGGAKNAPSVQPTIVTTIYIKL